MVTLAIEAMATRFELVLPGSDEPRLRAAGEAALRTIERQDRLLSFYRADSEVTRLNRLAAAAPVRLPVEVFRLLRACSDLSAATGGAFDITVGPLMRAWRFVGDRGAKPDPAHLADVRPRTGMHLVELDDEACSVRFLASGVEIDLGAVGKGYAIDLAIEELRESGIELALLHGGTSSVYGLGTPMGRNGWPIALAGRTAGQAPPRTLHLRDAALSVSATHGKAFSADGRQYGHVLDPRTGVPVLRHSAWVTGPESYLCDALSTALLVSGPEWEEEMRSRWKKYRGECTEAGSASSSVPADPAGGT